MPLFNLWTLWWNADRLAHGFRGYWNAPIFHPAHDAFAFSEPQPASLIVAPWFWLGTRPATAYNTYLLLALTLNGWCTFRLMLRLNCGTCAALCTGAMVELLPFVHWQLGVLQLVPLYGVIVTIHALVNLGDAPEFKTAMQLGTAFALTYAMCANYGLFLAVLLVPGGVCLVGPGVLRLKTWGWLVASGVLAAVLLAPIVVVQLRMAKSYQFDRTPQLMTDLSAHAGDYTIAPWRQFVDLPDRSNDIRRPSWKLSPGTFKLVLAALGILRGLIDRRFRRCVLFCAVVAALSIALSLGPPLTLGGWHPYNTLVTHCPGFAQVRNVFRFALFAQLMVACLAGVGLDLFGTSWLPAAIHWIPGARLANWSRLAVTLLLVLTGASATGEGWPRGQGFYTLPDAADQRDWLTWAQRQAPAGAVFACIPLPDGATVGAYQDTAVWMYWGMWHKHPLVNGYSGFFPNQFLALREAALHFPDRNSLAHLATAEVDYCIVRRSAATRAQIEGDPQIAPFLQWILGDDRAELDVYQLANWLRPTPSASANGG